MKSTNDVAEKLALSMIFTASKAGAKSVLFDKNFINMVNGFVGLVVVRGLEFCHRTFFMVPWKLHKKLQLPGTKYFYTYASR